MKNRIAAWLGIALSLHARSQSTAAAKLVRQRAIAGLDGAVKR